MTDTHPNLRYLKNSAKSAVETLRMKVNVYDVLNGKATITIDRETCLSIAALIEAISKVSFEYETAVDKLSVLIDRQQDVIKNQAHVRTFIESTSFFQIMAGVLYLKWERRIKKLRGRIS